MEQPLISIIIPVYNGEKYFRSCVESILHQTYEHWELLLIDDGSYDSSGSICDEYATDPRITAVHKKNGGQAAARNDGIAMAKGEYISFVDCDDWLDVDMYERMLQTMQAQQAEIIICGYIEEYMNRQKKIHADGEMKVYEASEALKLVLQGKIGSYLWSMLFKREVVQELMPDLNPYEDHATIFKWISHAHRVVTLHRSFYHYRQLQGSSLHSFNPRNASHFFLAAKERYNYMNEHQPLPGWEAENRRLYLHGCIKQAKDLARWPVCDEPIRAIISEIAEELQRFQPVRWKEIGTKYYIRMRLLLASPRLFVSILRTTWTLRQHIGQRLWFVKQGRREFIS
jgi:glycosyltransferase involved in cell wall biosynthesis